MTTPADMREAAACFRAAAARSLRDAERLEREADAAEEHENQLWFEEDFSGEEDRRPWFYIGSPDDHVKLRMDPAFARRIIAKLGAWLAVVEPGGAPEWASSDDGEDRTMIDAARLRARLRVASGGAERRALIRDAYTEATGSESEVVRLRAAATVSVAIAGMHSAEERALALLALAEVAGGTLRGEAPR